MVLPAAINSLEEGKAVQRLCELHIKEDHTPIRKAKYKNEHTVAQYTKRIFSKLVDLGLDMIFAGLP